MIRKDDDNNGTAAAQCVSRAGKNNVDLAEGSELNGI